jgi:hypothetical protein
LHLLSLSLSPPAHHHTTCTINHLALIYTSSHKSTHPQLSPPLHHTPACPPTHPHLLFPSLFPFPLHRLP